MKMRPTRTKTVKQRVYFAVRIVQIWDEEKVKEARKLKGLYKIEECRNETK